MPYCPNCGEEATCSPDDGKLKCIACGWVEPEQPIALQVREEKLEQIMPLIDCKLIDARSRKVLLYLVNEEIKKLGRMPIKWSKDSLDEMKGLKEGLELCKEIRSKKDEN